MTGRRRALARMLTMCLILGAGGALAPTTATATAAVSPAGRPVPPIPDPRAAADQTTISHDTLRTGWDQNEPGLAPDQVSSSDFGQQFSTAVDGQVYAQPLVIGGTVVVATENNKVYGLDAASGKISWTKELGTPWPASAINCGDLVPNIGVTSTPVYDPETKSLLLTSKVNDGPDVQHPNWYVHSLDPVTGAERSGWPIKVGGTPTNDPAHAFNPFTAGQRAGLLLLDGSVYIGFASHCIRPPYVGYLLGVNTTTRKTTMWATQDSSATGAAGIWQGGGAPVSDGPGRIFVTTGNGRTPPVGPGNTPPGQLSESVVRLAVQSDGSLSAKDFFSPSDAEQLDQKDTDLGAGGPVALPGTPFGTSSHPRLLVQIGKDGRLFLLDRDDLGGRSQGPGGTDKVLGTFGPYEGVWGHPAAYGGQGGYVYTIGNRGPLRAFAYGLTGSGAPALTNTGSSAEKFGYTSGSPVITSTGTNPGSALVWGVYTDGANGANGQLRAYDAVPVDGTLKLRWSAPIGTASKFSVPATDAGRVYVGTRDGRVLAFGRPANIALTSDPVDFGKVAVGSSGSATATVKATRDVTIDAVRTPAGGAFTARPTGLPRTLHAGDTYSVPVSFAPTGPGPAASVLTFATNLGDSAVGLSGYGTRPGLVAAPTALDFGSIPTTTTKSLGVVFTNTGTQPETVSGSVAPAAPFRVTGLPGSGTVVQPQQSVSVQVAYNPTAAGDQTGRLSLTGQNGTATVDLKGNAVSGQAKLTLTPASTDFGSVKVGQSITETFDIGNSGNIPLTLTKAKAPAAPFHVADPVSEGLVLRPGEVFHQKVTFSPTAVGTANATYEISADDGSGTLKETLTGTGTAGTGVTVPAPDAGGWKLNGNARMSGGDLQLTQAVTDQRGSAVWPVPVLTDGLHASFTTSLSGGNGADGLSLALLDAAGATPTALGAGGGGLGYSGLPGVAVTLDTYRNGADPSANFVGIATAGTGDTLTYASTTTNVPSLRSGTHTVDVAVSGRTLTVSVDGTQRLSTSVASLPPTAYLAFTGATGGKHDIHTVRKAAITAAAFAVPPPGPNGWTYNGSAVLSGGNLILTPAQSDKTGSAIHGTAVPSAQLNARFAATIGGGTGADGLALLLLDATKATPKSLGSGGGGLGYAGLPGVAVTLDTYANDDTDPSSNFVAVATKGTGSALTYAATATNVPNLRSGSHIVEAVVVSGHLQVSIDGTRVIDVAVALPQNVLVGFSGATGGSTDQHAVAGVRIGY
ncbi:choice-of-anchor D domain-containing protein [Streptomyces sp. NPDC085481]|uniref:choice-of-anchor D domain-containing protein n=1 Tax=Streptomyces sp. NPDC085481 TaxID=3365727 RepID=UPI0037D2EE65